AGPRARRSSWWSLPAWQRTWWMRRPTTWRTGGRTGCTWIPAAGRARGGRWRCLRGRGRRGARATGDRRSRRSWTCRRPGRGPTAVAVDAHRNVYIADTDNHRVRMIVYYNGTITTVAGTGEAGDSGDGGLATEAQLSSPQGLAVASNGDLYIVDTGNHRVRIV